MKQGVKGEVVKGFRIEAPYLKFQKSDVTALGYKLGAPLSLSYSCYKGGEIHCGKCGACIKRIEGFLDSNTPDLTEYADKEFAISELQRIKESKNNVPN
jgi:7-cyano-7-deazaguanine synthase in queuosine biosynthesis